MADCPCGENCPTCESGQCSEFCPTTTTTTTTTSTTATTTTKTTESVIGDMILIISYDKVMLHSWPLGQTEFFDELQPYDNHPNSKFDLNGYWVMDACSVYYKGESYLIGGVFGGRCDNGGPHCTDLNVPRAVVKLSKTSCGLGQS